MAAIIHVDMDAFYASVEERDHPQWRGKPLIVGGHARRGVVLAASYAVRPFGVRSAMPMAWALKRAPHAIVVPPRFEAYAAASEEVFSVFARFTPLIEGLSLDEAFLDVTGSQKLFGSPAQMAARIREEIFARTGLAASAGIASVKFVAKIASDFAKPNGQKEVLADDTRTFLAPLPIGRLWGVGEKLEAELVRHGINVIGDLCRREPSWLAENFGATGAHLWELAHGIDTRAVVPDREAKSIGAEDTFEIDLHGEDTLQPHIHSQALRVAVRLRKANLKARCVQLKLKYADFKVITRRTTLPEPTDDGRKIFSTAMQLFERTEKRPLRLTGVSASELHGEAQLSLLAPDPKAARLNRALDAIDAKFGAHSVTTADLADELKSGDQAARLYRWWIPPRHQGALEVFLWRLASSQIDNPRYQRNCPTF